MIKTFVKKPVEIHAVQWTGDNFSEIADFVGAENLVCIGRCGGFRSKYLHFRRQPSC